jgi:hypothetical protein
MIQFNLGASGSHNIVIEFNFVIKVSRELGRTDQD